MVLDHFTKRNIKLVIRLNKKLYGPEHFTDAGIEHRESASWAASRFADAHSVL